MSSIISAYLEPQALTDIFQNDKKFVLLPAADFVVEPLVGDMLKLSRSTFKDRGHIYRVITLVEKLDLLTEGDAAYYALSVRPLGKAEKEELRA